MNKYLIVGMGLLLFILGLNLYRQRKLNREYANMYSEFLKSDKYKVKGQFD
ncbi:MAG: hypothetical protein ABIB47_01875 [Candidatus Woesearchaeota archaeon]